MEISAPISVISPGYNRVSYIDDTLASVFSQSCSNIELFAVDDGSCDGAYEHLENIMPRVR